MRDSPTSTSMDETESGHFKATSTQHATLSDHPDLRSIHATSTSTSDDVEIDNVPADRGSRPRRNTVRFADNNEVVVVLAGSSLPVSDPVPAYEPRHCTSEEIKPGYVSQSMHEVWQAAQDKHERKKSIKSPQFIWLKALGMALAAVTIIGTNAATVYCSTIFMQRITSISNTLDNRDEGLIAGISGLSDDYKLSYPTLAKAAALAGLLTSLPALLVGLYALALKRKLDKMREDDAWVVV